VDGESYIVLLVLLVLVIPLFVGLFLLVRFFAALQRALRRVHPDHRRMSPERVWLNFIPVFNFVWAPATVVLVAESLRNEYRSRGLDSPDEDYGRFTGLSLLTLLATGCLFYPAFLTYPAALWVWVRYWLAVNRYARELKTGAVRDATAGVEQDEGW
jgi:hypothetical protein